MNSLSIQSLLPDNKYITKNGKNEPLSIKTLIRETKNYDESRAFTEEVLIKKRQDKRNIKLNMYMKHYSRCIEHIKIASGRDELDFIYKIPAIAPECPGYLALECSIFIIEKLKDIFIDAFNIDDRTIFITWKYVELNKNIETGN